MKWIETEWMKNASPESECGTESDCERVTHSERSIYLKMLVLGAYSFALLSRSLYFCIYLRLDKSFILRYAHKHRAPISCTLSSANLYGIFVVQNPSILFFIRSRLRSSDDGVKHVCRHSAGSARSFEQFVVRLLLCHCIVWCLVTI